VSDVKKNKRGLSKLEFYNNASSAGGVAPDSVRDYTVGHS